ncbi:MAG: TonB-dependent receptor [Chitinophagaceae bacterium]
MTRKRLFAGIALLFLCLPLSLLAQERIITGKVTDAKDGSPITGASVIPKGGKSGASTNLEGAFSLKVSADVKVLTISSVGYLSQDVALTGDNAISISLSGNQSNLNEVVVIGYGVQRKRDVVGAIAKVGGDKISATPVPSFEAALQGKAPGVQIIQGNGLAGSGSVVRIRGIGSITAGGDPLYVIDGVPVISDPFLRSNGGAMNQNPLSSINPNDIESVEVLKDASATGIYGSRGANGVILITTKRGKTGKPAFTYNAKLGAATYAQKVDFVNGAEWLQLRQEGWVNDGKTGYADLPGKITWAQAQNTNTNWWDQLTQVGFINEHSLSMSQGNAKFKSFANLTYSNDEGYIKSNAYERLSARFNADYKPINKLKISLSAGFNRGVNKRVPAAWDGGIGDAMSSALPIYPIYNTDGTYFIDGANPVRRVNETKRREIDNRLLTSLSIEYELIKNLFLRAQGSLEYINSYDDQYESYQWQQKSTPDSGYAKRAPYWGTNWTTTYTANYLWEPTTQHRFNFLVGAEVQESKLKEYTGEIGQFFGEPYYKDPSAYRKKRDELVDGGSITTRQKDAWTFNSFFGRLNYVFNGRYALQLSARVDGSSKFGSNNKHGFFPAAALAWTVSDEEFMKSLTFVDFLKLRASYGIVGNANIPSGSYYDNYQRGGNNYNGSATEYLNALGNPNLKWETLRNFDFAMEYALLNNTLTGEIAYYHKATTDILLQPGISPSNGYDKAWRNLSNSKILNEGIEFSANYKIINTKKLTWSIGGNIAKNYNEVKEYELGPDAVSGGTNDTRIVKGLPVGVNYLVRYQGVDPNDGLPIWLDKNGKETKTFSLDNRVYAGTVMPDYVGGINTAVNYKGFDFSTLFSFVIGGNLYDNSGKYQFLGASKKFWNVRKDFLDRWTKPGDNAKYPRLVSDATNYPGVPSEDQFNSTMFLHKASYMRMRELTLGYTFSSKKLQRLKLKGLRVGVTGTNLLTFSKYPGGDPEITRDFENAQDRNLSPNVTYLTAPTQRTVVFVLNVNF